VLCDGCFKALFDMRLKLVRDAHFYFKHPVASGANEMVMMLIFRVAAQEKHGLTIIPMHAIEQTTLHQPVNRPVNSRETNFAAQHTV
jgi:hypothetical protein